MKIADLTISTKIYGEKRAHECPFCKCYVNIVGDLNNPCVTITGQHICDPCIEKINKLINP